MTESKDEFMWRYAAAQKAVTELQVAADDLFGDDKVNDRAAAAAFRIGFLAIARRADMMVELDEFIKGHWDVRRAEHLKRASA